MARLDAYTWMEYGCRIADRHPRLGMLIYRAALKRYRRTG